MRLSMPTLRSRRPEPRLRSALREASASPSFSLLDRDGPMTFRHADFGAILTDRLAIHRRAVPYGRRRGAPEPGRKAKMKKLLLAIAAAAAALAVSTPASVARDARESTTAPGYNFYIGVYITETRVTLSRSVAR